MGLAAQSCLTLCDPMDSSPPGSSVHGVLQARTLEWVAMAAHNDQVNPAFLTVSVIPSGGGDLELSIYTSAE